ncbi:hypothetical protein F5X68DRAFT_24582 [Plectosphaerella plurivora]|uniref:Uncharacterized protein n=1 Tax=Plectosphaerella plurivora TaxID=936078 RepID=A0A9P8V793_9PEZI|nr:hypothetical protein F5X68DRAFT_24582 [Plectosphaerella plurivora]
MKLLALSTLITLATAIPAGTIFSRHPCPEAAGCTQRVFQGDDEYYCCSSAQSSVVTAQCASACHRTETGHGFACTGGAVGWHCHSH